MVTFTPISVLITLVDLKTNSGPSYVEMEGIIEIARVAHCDVMFVSPDVFALLGARFGTAHRIVDVMDGIKKWTAVSGPLIVVRRASSNDEVLLGRLAAMY